MKPSRCVYGFSRQAYPALAAALSVGSPRSNRPGVSGWAAANSAAACTGPIRAYVRAQLGDQLVLDDDGVGIVAFQPLRSQITKTIDDRLVESEAAQGDDCRPSPVECVGGQGWR